MNNSIKCPVCGERITYTGNTGRDDDWEYAEWKCENCGATGIGNFEIVFREHTDITTREGKSRPDKKAEDCGTFWVSWIAVDRSGKPYSLGSNEACLSLDEAKKVVDKLLGNYGEEIIAAWIDRHDSDGKKIDTPFHEVYVDVMGNWRCKHTLNSKCPLCGKEVKFDGKHWYCKPCSAEGTVENGVLVISSCSAKGSMSDLVSNY